MTAAEVLLEEPVETWDATEIVHALSEQVQSLAPEGCCIHGETFCLSCGLTWAVEQNVPLRID